MCIPIYLHTVSVLKWPLKACMYVDEMYQASRFDDFPRFATLDNHFTIKTVITTSFFPQFIGKWSNVIINNIRFRCKNHLIWKPWSICYTNSESELVKYPLNHNNDDICCVYKKKISEKKLSEDAIKNNQKVYICYEKEDTNMSVKSNLTLLNHIRYICTKWRFIGSSKTQKVNRKEKKCTIHTNPK